MAQDIVCLDTPISAITPAQVVAALNIAMFPYWRLEQDPGDVLNSATFKLELHQAGTGKFTMPFLNIDNLDNEVPRV